MSNEHSLIVLEKAKSPAAEAFRTLRTNIQFSKVTGGLRSLMITSPGPQEGKSTVAANTAAVMAQTGKKTIIIDCDLRKPVQHHVFNKPNRGLADYLMEEATIEQFIQTTIIENLFLLTSGTVPPNPSELLGSAKMMELLVHLKSYYDFLILDLPPVIAVTDASVLASQVDGIALVVRAGVSRPEMVRRAKELLLHAHGNLLGVILNRVEVAKGYSRYYYYYGSD
jgi:capsular exopolysaccharide synthesis family protein